MSNTRAGLWAGGEAYEKYMGRWSRRIAPLFLDWLSVPPDADWIDIGCGTGVLSSVIMARCVPKRVVGIDPSAPFIESARSQVDDRRFQCRQGNGEALPCEDKEFAVAVSGLVLNFVGDKKKAVAEMKRVVRLGGRVALYVWDYAGHMQIMRYFFDAAAELDAGAREFDDGVKAPICRPGPLSSLFQDAGLADVEVQGLDIPTAFENFDDYWMPFLGGTGSAPKYCTSLSSEAQARLQENLRNRLPTGPDGEILLAVRAWAIKGRVVE
jgi:SAM-dependent methyltransferase